MPHIKTRLYKFNADADLETTYPTCEIIMNLGKETTISEPCRIKGVGIEAQRKLSINLTAGPVNAIEIMQSACKIKSLDDWAEEIRRRHYPDKAA